LEEEEEETIPPKLPEEPHALRVAQEDAAVDAVEACCDCEAVHWPWPKSEAAAEVTAALDVFDAGMGEEDPVVASIDIICAGKAEADAEDAD
jgi:hypothetical protein